MMEKLWDVVIVGGGPAGYSAALYAVRAGYSTLVVEMLSPGGQMATTNAIENYPGFVESVDGFELAMTMQQQAEKFGSETLYAQVTAVQLAGPEKALTTTEGTLRAKAVIFATGADPRPLGLPGEDGLRGRGVAYCATCDGGFYRGKTVAVAGGGNSAAEDALTLSKLCKKVYLIHRRDTLSATRSYLKPLEKAENIEFLWNKQVTGFEVDGTLTGLTLTDTQTGAESLLPVDGLFAEHPAVQLTDEGAGRIARGAVVFPRQAQGLPGEPDTLCRVYHKDHFLMLGQVRTLDKGGVGLFVYKNFR